MGGIKTTLPFFRQIVRDEEFIAGRLDTDFISRFNQRRAEREARNYGTASGSERVIREAINRDMAIIAAALAYASVQRPQLNYPSAEQSKWKLAGRPSSRGREVRKKARR